MGQIVSSAAKPKRCNLNQLSQVPTPAAGEHILVSSDNSMNAAGQGNFDCYIKGDGTTAATALELKAIDNVTTEFQSETIQIPVTISKGRFDSNGNYVAENTRRSTNKISVTTGEKYLISVNIGTSSAIAYLGQWNGDTFVGIPSEFAHGTGNAVDREYIVPSGVDTIALSSTNTTAPSLKKVVSSVVAKSYTKEESNTLLDGKVDKVTGKGLSTNDFTNADKEKLDNLAGGGKYGVKWSLNDYTDLGTRVFDAEGKTATIGRGATDGQSDFDSILPWAGMKRCNIKTNSNGANIVTFEGEAGFALDGSNGDVFVRVPKFKADHYIENGYEYLVIGEGSVHPAFIENGVELDEIFIGAYEASGDSTEIYSKSGVIPANNITPQGFLDGAQAKGTCFSLYDMRCVDALWMLMAVEYGCRNSNRIIGYGLADFYQPVFSGRGVCVEAATNTNSIKVGYFTSAYKLFMPVGGNITICGNQDQRTILTQAKITGVTDGPNNEYTIFTFDGPAIDVDTNCFVGSAPFNTDFIDTCVNPLTWHTGRALAVSGGEQEITRNPVRYRWIENPVGNLWHYLPDVTFNNLQMYVCKDMAEYVMHKYTYPYVPVGNILPEQNNNGSKSDVNTSSSPNYWITALLNDIFAKGNCFGKAFDVVHDGTLTSQKGYGGYYYLMTGIKSIANGGGFDHLYRCNILTNRAWIATSARWYLEGARLMFKRIY